MKQHRSCYKNSLTGQIEYSHWMNSEEDCILYWLKQIKTHPAGEHWMEERSTAEPDGEEG